MTSLTRHQFYIVARAAAKGGAFKIEFPDRPMAIAFLRDVAGLPSRLWEPTQDAHYIDRWDIGDGYVAQFGIGALVVFSPTIRSHPGVIWFDDCVLCTQCARRLDHLFPDDAPYVPVTNESHPDGFTCWECDEVVSTAQ